MRHSHLHLVKFEAHRIITSLFMISNGKGALFLTRFTTKNFFKVHSLRHFIHHGLPLSTKWKVFLVLLWFVSLFEKIKNKTLHNVFFF